MCGLAGFTGHKPANPTKIRLLLMANETRGSDSTGIFGKRLMRKATKASEFIKDPNFDHIAESNVVLAHTRRSTGGGLTKENSHPFIHYGEGRLEVIGTHNGWVVNEHEAEQKLENFKREDVDSSTVFKYMALSKDKLGFSLFEGPMALAFIWDGDLHLFRRDTRPLYVGKAKEGWYYSSIPESLENIGIPDNKVNEVIENRLIRFKGSTIIENKIVPGPRVKFTSNTYYGYWEHLVKSPELMEELTGKKYQAPSKKSWSKTQGSGLGLGTHGQRGTTTRENTGTGTESKTRNHGMNFATMKDMKRVGFPNIIGNDIIITLERDRIYDSASMNKAIEENLKNRKAPMELRVNNGLLHMTDRWISNPVYDTVVRSRMPLLVKDIYSPETKPKGWIETYSGIKLSIDLLAYRKDEFAYQFVRKSVAVIVGVEDKDGYLFTARPSGDSEFFLNYPDLMHGKGMAGGNFERSAQVTIMVVDEACPGLIFSTTVTLQYGKGYMFKAIINMDDWLQYTGKVVFDRKKLDTNILPAHIMEKATEMFKDYLLNKGVESITDIPTESLNKVMTTVNFREKKYMYQNKVSKKVDNLLLEEDKSNNKEPSFKEIDTSEYFITDPDQKKSEMKKDTSSIGSTSSEVIVNGAKLKVSARGITNMSNTIHENISGAILSLEKANEWLASDRVLMATAELRETLSVVSGIKNIAENIRKSIGETAPF